MRELAASGITVTVSCRVLLLARQPYYRWVADPVTPTEIVWAYRANALLNAHREDPELGYRLLADEVRENGEGMCDRIAWQITSTYGWWSVFGKHRHRRGAGPAVHDDRCAVIDKNRRIRHEFTARTPNQLWLTDITEHYTSWIPVVVATCAFKMLLVKQPFVRRGCPNLSSFAVVR